MPACTYKAKFLHVCKQLQYQRLRILFNIVLQCVKKHLMQFLHCISKFSKTVPELTNQENIYFCCF